MTMQFTIRSRLDAWRVTLAGHVQDRYACCVGPSVCCLFLRAYIPFIFLIMILAEGLLTLFCIKRVNTSKILFMCSIVADFEHIRRVLKFLVTFWYNVQLNLFLVNNYGSYFHKFSKIGTKIPDFPKINLKA